MNAATAPGLNLEFPRGGPMPRSGRRSARQKTGVELFHWQVTIDPTDSSTICSTSRDPASTA